MRINIRGAPCGATTVCGLGPTYRTSMRTDDHRITGTCLDGGACHGGSIAAG